MFIVRSLFQGVQLLIPYGLLEIALHPSRVDTNDIELEVMVTTALLGIVGDELMINFIQYLITV